MFWKSHCLQVLIVESLSQKNIISGKTTQLVKLYKTAYEINNVQYKIDEINRDQIFTIPHFE